MDKYVLNYTTCLLAMEEIMDEFDVIKESKHSKVKTIDLESLIEFFEELKKYYKAIVKREISLDDYLFLEERILHCLDKAVAMEKWLKKSKDNILVIDDDFAELMIIKGTLIEHLKMVQDTIKRLQDDI